MSVLTATNQRIQEIFDRADSAEAADYRALALELAGRIDAMIAKGWQS